MKYLYVWLYFSGTRRKIWLLQWQRAPLSLYQHGQASQCLLFLSLLLLFASFVFHPIPLSFPPCFPFSPSSSHNPNYNFFFVCEVLTLSWSLTSVIYGFCPLPHCLFTLNSKTRIQLSLPRRQSLKVTAFAGGLTRFISSTNKPKKRRLSLK